MEIIMTYPEPAKQNFFANEHIGEWNSFMDSKATENDFLLSSIFKISKERNWQSNITEELKNILNSFYSHRMEWAVTPGFFKITGNEIFPMHNILNEDTVTFIKQYRLQQSIAWLFTAVSNFFPGADYEIELLPGENEEENLLALRVYGSLSTSVFRERRHALCKSMIESGHSNLYEVISIFQRRMRNDGREAISWYSSLVAA